MAQSRILMRKDLWGFRVITLCIGVCWVIYVGCVLGSDFIPATLLIGLVGSPFFVLAFGLPITCVESLDNAVEVHSYSWFSTETYSFRLDQPAPALTIEYRPNDEGSGTFFLCVQVQSGDMVILAGGSSRGTVLDKQQMLLDLWR